MNWINDTELNVVEILAFRCCSPSKLIPVKKKLWIFFTLSGAVWLCAWVLASLKYVVVMQNLCLHIAAASNVSFYKSAPTNDMCSSFPFGFFASLKKTFFLDNIESHCDGTCLRKKPTTIDFIIRLLSFACQMTSNMLTIYNISLFPSIFLISANSCQDQFHTDVYVYVYVRVCVFAHQNMHDIGKMFNYILYSYFKVLLFYGAYKIEFDIYI